MVLLLGYDSDRSIFLVIWVFLIKIWLKKVVGRVVNGLLSVEKNGGLDDYLTKTKNRVLYSDFINTRII